MKLGLSLLLAASIVAQGQATKLPDAPSTVYINRGLEAADITLRVLDGKSTHMLLNDPCKCFHEIDPIAPKGGEAWKVYGFQTVAGFAVIGGSRLLRSHGHPKLARTLVLIDIGSEIWAVQNNFRQHRPEQTNSLTR